MANSFVRYTGNGSTTTYSVPFSYRSQDDITVTIGGVVTTAFTYNAAGTEITFTSPPADQSAIQITRKTSQGTKLVDYTSGSVLTEGDLDTDSDQAFFMAQEAIDDADDVIKISAVNFQWDATSKRITNVSDPTSAQDAATKTWVETAATSQVTAATTQATNAANSATAAATSASNASTSESNAATSATNASNSATTATTQASNASTSATNAATSATNAATSETNAATSATNASTSETNAATSASNASTSESNASSSASAASTSATAAASSATSASGSATTATTKASEASTSATNAATSATNAATSETNAATSETNAANSATAAATSATNASNSETNAATSATNAATSATEASTSATNAAASYDSFDDRYLGAKSSAPTVDNDGDALITGALYFDTTANEMRVYDGSSWAAAGSAVNGTSGRFVYTATAGQTTFSGADDNGATLAYDTGFIDVYLNGVKMVNGTDVTVTSGTSVVFASGVALNDIVEMITYGAFNLASFAATAITSGTLNIARIADGSITDAKLANPKERNLIINGDMRIAQRDTSVTGKTASGYFTVDRWLMDIGTAGTWTISQSTDVPSGQGFGYSTKWDCTTANASLSAGSFMSHQQRFEGQELQTLRKGTSNAETTTISFWVKSNKTGTYIVEIEDRDNTRHISQSYTIDSASTWEKKTLTFAGDTTGAFDNDTAASVHLFFWLVAGTNYSSGTLATSWAAKTNANRAVGQVNLADSTSNEFYITGIQWELGSTASDFEHLNITEQLQLCKRYFQISSFGADWNGNDFFGGSVQHSMRATPSTSNVTYDISSNINTGNGVNGLNTGVGTSTKDYTQWQFTRSAGSRAYAWGYFHLSSEL